MGYSEIANRAEAQSLPTAKQLAADVGYLLRMIHVLADRGIECPGDIDDDIDDDCGGQIEGECRRCVLRWVETEMADRFGKLRVVSD